MERCILNRKERIEALKQEVRERTPKSGAAFQRALEVYPNGEISAARGFDPWPFYAVKGDGAFIWDVDGNRYLDCCIMKAFQRCSGDTARPRWTTSNGKMQRSR